MRSIFVVTTVSAPSTAMAPPDSPLPAPRGTIGTPCAGGQADDGRHLRRGCAGAPPPAASRDACTRSRPSGRPPSRARSTVRCEVRQRGAQAARKAAAAAPVAGASGIARMIGAACGLGTIGPRSPRIRNVSGRIQRILASEAAPSRPLGARHDRQARRAPRPPTPGRDVPSRAAHHARRDRLELPDLGRRHGLHRPRQGRHDLGPRRQRVHRPAHGLRPGHPGACRRARGRPCHRAALAAASASA